MNTYYVGNILVSDKLYHYGIVGQKWGVRRYQNKDGTLTTEGKARYGSEKEQKKFAEKVMSNKINLRNTPQVQHAVANLKSEAKDERTAKKKYDDEVEKFFNDKKIYGEYLEKAADKTLKDFPNIINDYRNSRPLGKQFKDMNDRDIVKYFIQNDDWGQGDYDPLTIFMDSGDKRAKPLVDADRQFVEAQRKLSSAAQKYVDAFLGDYGNQEYRSKLSGFPKGLKLKVGGTVQNAIFYATRDKYDKEYN